MSFWEDRFVNRPHAGAVPPSPYTDPQRVDPVGSAYPQIPTPDPEPAWGAETFPVADEIGDPVELVEAEAVEAEPVEADPVEAEAGDDVDFAHEVEDEPVYEYRRKGLFRRRQPVLVDAVTDDGAEVDEEQPESHEDDSFEEPTFEEPTYEEPSYESPSYEAPSYESEVEEPETWTVVSESEEEYEDEVAETDELAPVEKKRGFFRRRKHAEAESVVENDEELEAAVEDEEAEPEEHFWYAPPVEGDEDEQHDELAASAETLDVPAEEPKRRGIFRRRKSAPVEEPVVEDADASSVEDDSFANVPYWGSEVSDATEEPSEESPAEPSEAADDAESEVEEPSTYVFGEDESATEDAAVESEPVEDGSVDTEPGSAPDHEVYSDAQDQTSEDAVAPEPESVETEVYAAEEEPAQTYDDGAALEPESAPESEPVEELVEETVFVDESELETEPTVSEWHGADEAHEGHDEYEADASYDEVVHEPVPLKKRNGGGSRGKKVVGLKVGASQIAAAVVSGAGDSQALVDVARRPIEQGVVVGGELRDPEALVRALKAFFKESRLPTKNVRLGLSSSRVGVRMFDIAGVEDETRFDNAVRFKAHEVLPVAAHESVLDYRVVEERYTESGEVSRRVLLVVAPRDQVEPYIEACHAAGLRLAGVDLESFGLLRAFVPPFGSRSRTEDSATVVVAIGHEASTLLVAGGGICEFTRVFDWGGGALQTAIADELEVPHMEAATILTHLSLSGPGRHLESLDADTRSRALEAVRARLTPFARELVSSLQFYQTQPESLGIREILITGGTSHLEGLADALHQMIGVSVSVGDPLGRVDVQVDIPPALDATIGSLAVPIGLAIEDEAGRSVNLLPRESRQTRKRPNALALAGPLAAAIPLAALAFMFVQANGAAGDSQAELNAVRAQISALPEPTQPTLDPALATDQAARATAVAQILGSRLTWEKVLGDVSRVLPTGVSLTELIATAPQPSTPEVVSTTTEGTTGTTPPPAPVAAPTSATGVTVTGYALNYADIARTLARLQAVPSLTNAELQSATPSTIGKKRIIEFTIAATLATPGGVQ